MEKRSAAPLYNSNHEETVLRRQLGVRLQERRLSLKNSPLMNNKKKATQKSVAEELGVNIDTVKSWESGSFLPSLLHLKKLCKILDCDADYLLGNIDRPYRRAYDLEADTGLSGKSCALIHNLPHIFTDYQGNEFPYSFTDALDSLLSNELFMPFLNEYMTYTVSSMRAYVSARRAQKRVPKRKRYEKITFIPTDDQFDVDLALIDSEDAVKCHEFEALDIMRKIIESQSAFESDEFKQQIEKLLDGKEIDKALRINPLPEKHVYYSQVEITPELLAHELLLLCRSVKSPSGYRQKLSPERVELLEIQFESIVSRIRTLADYNPDEAEEAIRKCIYTLEREGKDIVPNATDRICLIGGETYKQYVRHY